MTTCVLMVSRTFLSNHPKYGQQTGFIEKIKSGEKIHTIRMNYPLWRKIFDKIEAGEMCLSLRYWTGDPYRSKQEEFLRLTREDGIGVQMGVMYRKVIYDQAIYEMTVMDDTNEWQVKNRTKLYKFGEYAKNDGLETEDFIRWFEPTFEKEWKMKPLSYFNPKLTQLTVAIIHFTKFRY